MAAIKHLISQSRIPHFQLTHLLRSHNSLRSLCSQIDPPPPNPNPNESEPLEPSRFPQPVVPQSISYPVKPKPEPNDPQNPNGGENGEVWSREDFRYVKDMAASVSYPSRVAPLPEDRKYESGESEGDLEMRRRRESEERVRKRVFRMYEEEKLPFPTLIRQDGERKAKEKVVFDLKEAIHHVKAHTKCKFDETLEAHVKMTPDLRRTDLLQKSSRDIDNIEMWVNCRRNLQYLQNIRNFSKSPWLVQTCSYSSFKKTKNDPLQDRRMIDRYRLSAKGGDGGNGCYSIRRSRHDRRGKADGANGGRGGDVILECSPRLWDFSSLNHHINAPRGGHGASKNMIGSRGSDKVVLVPVGTVVHLVAGEIPVVVEKKSLKDLDPWDIPGTVAINPEPTKQSSKNVSNVFEETKYNNRVVNSANRKKASGAPSAESLSEFPDYTNKNRDPGEDSNLWNDDNERDLETLGSGTVPDTVGDDMSETDNGEYMEKEDDLGEDMEEEDQVEYEVAELTEPGQQIIIARGGTGGLGNLCYPKAFKNPKLVKLGAQKNKGVDDIASEDDEHSSLSLGTPGSQAVLLLELKSIADVGLVGMPNAGKSTLLGSLSRAKPTVGHYAFTTLRPNLGNVNYVDFSVIVADIPGLIKGAHKNRGLGHAFLRHIERTKVLTYVLDLAAALDGRKGVHPWEQLKDLILELEFHREGLSSRPSIIVANKIDEPGTDKIYEELKRRVPGVPIFPVCAVLDEGVEELRSSLRKLVMDKNILGDLASLPQEIKLKWLP